LIRGRWRTQAHLALNRIIRGLSMRNVTYSYAFSWISQRLAGRLLLASSR
jgi:hypothetical protein